MRASGWGPAFLDGGSGYDIGERASMPYTVIGVVIQSHQSCLVAGTLRHVCDREPSLFVACLFQMAIMLMRSHAVDSVTKNMQISEVKA